MATAVYANPSDLAILQAVLHRHEYVDNGATRLVGTIITQFLTEPGTQANWERMHNAIQHFMNTNTAQQSHVGLRVLVTLADGHVAYDTSKTNTWANFRANTINENHNSRPAIMSALLGNLGMGYEVKYSSTDNQKEAYHVQRMGPSSHNALGCIRISVKSV
jgi:hypothetical protein